MPFGNFNEGNYFFDFNNTENFIDNISGAVQTSPEWLLGDEQQVQSLFVKNDSYDLPINEDLINPNLKTEEEDFFNTSEEQNSSQAMDPSSITYIPNSNDGINYASMSSGSYSNDSSSNSNDVTPLSHPSMSSTHTSPVSQTNLRLDDDSGSDTSQPKKNVKKNSNVNSKVTKPTKNNKTSHNMIEKKYRTNINSKIVALRDAVPSLRIAASGGNSKMSIADLEGLTPASKLNKASVLTKATEYIKHLEHKNEVLKNQNIQLQKLIQEASLRPMQPQPQSQHQPPQHPQQHQDNQFAFGFVPPQDVNSFNSTAVQQSYSGNSYSSYSSPPTSSGGANKYLLGGMAAVMGTSLLGGDGNDFQGLSALPFAHLLPHSLVHPSTLSIQLFNVIRVSLFIATIATLAYPTIEKWFNGSQDKNQIPEKNVWLSWLLVSLGVKLPVKIPEAEKEEIIARLMGKAPFSWSQLVSDYLYLSSSEINFENVFLNLITGTLLINKFPVLSKLLNFNMCLKGSLITSLDYQGENKSLLKLNKLIKGFDGVALLGSKSLTERLINLANNKPLNFDINDGENHLKCVELYQSNKSDYFGLIFDLRILQISHQLNLTFLESFSSKGSEEAKAQINEQIVKDAKIINNLIFSDATEASALSKYFRLFYAVVNPAEGARDLLESLAKSVSAQLSGFKVAMEGQELTDEEIISDDEAEDSQDISHEVKKSDFISKELITSLNLISQEQFVIVTCAMILYYRSVGKSSDAFKLLNYLKFDNEVSFSLLSFSAIIKVINELVDDETDEKEFGQQEVLDELIKTTRLWINDEKKEYFLDQIFRGNLSDMIISKGMILDGTISRDEEDEDN